MQQSVGDIGEIVQPVAQIGIGLALQLGARVVLDPLDRGLGGQPAAHRLAQPAQPAAVVRDHPEGFEHVAMLARPPSSLRSISSSTEARIASIAESSRASSRIHVVGDDLRHR